MQNLICNEQCSTHLVEILGNCNQGKLVVGNCKEGILSCDSYNRDNLKSQNIGMSFKTLNFIG